MSLQNFYGKKYKLFSSENFDEVLKALGVGIMMRKMGSKASPVIELTEDNGVFTFKSSSAFKNIVITFKLGEEFEEETPDGRKVKSLITQEENKLVHIQTGDKVTKIIREFTPEEVKMTLIVDDIVCTRIFKPVE